MISYSRIHIKWSFNGHCFRSPQTNKKSIIVLQENDQGCRVDSYDRVKHCLLSLVCPSRDQEWQPKEHPGPLLHPVPLQAAAAAAAAVLPVPGGAQPADQQHRTVRQHPQDTRDAVQVCCTVETLYM